MQTEPSKAEPPKRKRRRFQFRLRTLMIVVTYIRRFQEQQAFSEYGMKAADARRSK